MYHSIRGKNSEADDFEDQRRREILRLQAGKEHIIGRALRPDILCSYSNSKDDQRSSQEYSKKLSGSEEASLNQEHPCRKSEKSHAYSRSKKQDRKLFEYFNDVDSDSIADKSDDEYLCNNIAHDNTQEILCQKFELQEMISPQPENDEESCFEDPYCAVPTSGDSQDNSNLVENPEYYEEK